MMDVKYRVQASNLPTPNPNPHVFEGMAAVLNWLSSAGVCGLP